MSQSIRRPGRRSGRPPEESRQALLDAARDLFARREFAAVSLRQIADRAGVNPAMVHYHFQGKEGLYLALLEGQFMPLMARLEQISSERSSLTDFVGAYVQMLASNPWFPNLIVREVLYGETALRELFIERFAARAGATLQRLIDTERQAGRLRANLDPASAALSLLSLALFPFIARPVAERVFGIEMDETFTARWVEHATRLFYEGAKEHDR